MYCNFIQLKAELTMILLRTSIRNNLVMHFEWIWRADCNRWTWWKSRDSYLEFL